jgi:DNA repair exonuclease SbcCD ATPase subunit
MTENIDEEVLNRLEAEATVADAEPEELTLMVESDVEEKESQIEELEAEVEEKESEVEELQEELDEKGEELEDMQEEIDIMSEKYAEELSQSSEVMDKEDFLERFEFEELQEKAESLETDSGSSPSPNSGDVGAGFQSPNGEAGSEEEEMEISQKEELAASSFRDRAKQTGKDYWAEIAEEIENGGE